MGELTIDDVQSWVVELVKNAKNGGMGDKEIAFVLMREGIVCFDRYMAYIGNDGDKPKE